MRYIISQMIMYVLGEERKPGKGARHAMDWKGAQLLDKALCCVSVHSLQLSISEF